MLAEANEAYGTPGPVPATIEESVSWADAVLAALVVPYPGDARPWGVTPADGRAAEVDALREAASLHPRPPGMSPGNALLNRAEALGWPVSRPAFATFLGDGCYR